MNEEKLTIIAVVLALIFAVGMVTIEPVEGFRSQLGIGENIVQ